MTFDTHLRNLVGFGIQPNVNVFAYICQRTRVVINDVLVIVRGGIAEGEIVDRIGMYFVAVMVNEIGGVVAEVETRFHKIHTPFLFSTFWEQYTTCHVPFSSR